MHLIFAMQDLKRQSLINRFNQCFRALSVAAVILLNTSMAMAVRGGDSAGGGNINPEAPASLEQIIEAVKEAPPIILYYVNRMEQRSHEFQVGLCERGRVAPKEPLQLIADKLTTNSPTFFDLFKSGVVEVRVQDACYDRDGEVKDASIYPTSPGAKICVSAFRLSKKLTVRNYEANIRALILHEFSHLSGTSEDEAVLLQNDFYEHDVAWKFQNVGISGAFAAFERFYGGRSFFSEYRKSVEESKSSDEFCKVLRGLNSDLLIFPETFGQPSTGLSRSGYKDGSPFRDEEALTTQTIVRQLDVIERAFCSKDQKGLADWMTEIAKPRSQCSIQFSPTKFQGRSFTTRNEALQIFNESLQVLDSVAGSTVNLARARLRVLVR